MREIVFKNLTEINHRKSDLCIREVVTQKGIVATIERRCLYFVREQIYIEDPTNLEELKKLQAGNDAWKKRHFHILRDRATSTGEDKLICKVAGTLYAIIGHNVFCIAFIHSFKVELSSLTVGKN